MGQLYHGEPLVITKGYPAKIAGENRGFPKSIHKDWKEPWSTLVTNLGDGHQPNTRNVYIYTHMYTVYMYIYM